MFYLSTGYKICVTGGGILLGTIASIFIFKRRWPITTGLGIGMGFSFANCQYDLNHRNNTM